MQVVGESDPVMEARRVESRCVLGARPDVPSSRL